MSKRRGEEGWGSGKAVRETYPVGAPAQCPPLRLPSLTPMLSSQPSFDPNHLLSCGLQTWRPLSLTPRMLPRHFRYTGIFFPGPALLMAGRFTVSSPLLPPRVGMYPLFAQHPKYIKQTWLPESGNTQWLRIRPKALSRSLLLQWGTALGSVRT